MKKNFLLLAGFLFLFACAPFSKSVMDRVDPETSFNEVQRDPEGFRGRVVLWGGVIVETLNRANETLIKVRQTELDLEQRPKYPDRSQGRFIIQYNGFLDPAIYREGREITVAGEITGKEVLPLGNINYTYPVIKAQEIYLWERPIPYRPYYPPYYYDPFYPWWWHRPYWRHPFWW
jgi:outer membrane lipoprotein